MNPLLLTTSFTLILLDSFAPGMMVGILLYYVIIYCVPVIIVAFLVIKLVKWAKKKQAGTLPKQDSDTDQAGDSAENK